jgi:hypothetical protein
MHKKRRSAMLNRACGQYAMYSAPPLVIPDLNRPGALLPQSLRLPPKLVADLDGQAVRLGCSRAALSRALLSRGVEQLRESMPA